jgi:hypothetical protein
MKESFTKRFYSIFKDGNDWNEKTIIGFLAFAIMSLFAITDLITGYFGRELVVSDNIYNSFMYITLGSFGIDGIQKFAKGNKDEAVISDD